MINNSCWKPEASLKTSPASRFSRYFPLRFVHFKCQFDVSWPVIGFNSLTSPNKSIMAPRNLQPVGAANNGLCRRSQDDSADCNTIEGTLLTIGCCLLGGLLIVVACLALPLMLVLFVTYTLSSLAFNLFSTTSSRIRQIKHMVVPAIASEESPKKSPVVHGSSTPGKSCTDGTAFLPACITESDSFLEATVLRRAQMNDKKLADERF